MSLTPITRRDLPYLEVESIEEGPLVPAKDGQAEYRLLRIHGKVSEPSIVDPTAWCALLGPERNCLYGDWIAKPGPDLKVAFETEGKLTRTAIGLRLPYAGHLDAWAAVLIEDGPVAWQESTFSSKDAVATRYADPEGKLWRKLEEFSEEEPREPESEIVSGGWDHEHCRICNAHIDPGDRFYRHKSANEFLCVACYEKHVLTGDVSFLIEGDGHTEVSRTPE